MSECRGQLMERVRRGLASDQERVAFEAHLDRCESCQVSMDITADFEAVGAADSGDAERVARIAVAAQRLHRPKSTLVELSRRSRRVWRFAFAAVVLGGTAVAAGFAWFTIDSATPLPPAESSAARPIVSTTSLRPTPVFAQRQPAAAPAPSEVASPAPASPRPSEPEPPAATPGLLYREANQARRGGQTQLAVARYQELQRRFPGSAEAVASHVSLGGLLLQGGSAAAALRQFDRYLAGAGARRLAAEALYGRGQALRALGRTEAEARNWQRLVQEFPNSPYRTHAGRRLEELR